MSEAQQSSGVMGDLSIRNPQMKTFTGTRDLRDPRPLDRAEFALPLSADVLEPGAADVLGEVHEQAPTSDVAREPSQHTATSLAAPFLEALPLGTAIPFTADHVPDLEWLRLQVRQLLREFLSVVPGARHPPLSRSRAQTAHLVPFRAPS